MNDRFRLSESTIEEHVEKQTGVVMFYDSRGGPLRGVAVADDPTVELLEYQDDYAYFSIEYVDSHSLAFERAVKLFHFLRPQFEGQPHPEVPEDEECPLCSTAAPQNSIDLFP